MKRTKRVKKFKQFGKLPGKPSALIRIALDDLKKAEKDPTMKISMDTWLQVAKNGVDKCAVCMAGSVMAKRLAPTFPELVSKIVNYTFQLFGNITNTNLSPENHWGAKPENFPEEEPALSAIDDLRRGWVMEAFHALEINGYNFYKEGALLDHYPIPEYSTQNRTKFHQAMRKLARTLEKAGF